MKGLPLSLDLRERIDHAVNVKAMTWDEAADALSVSPATISRLMRLKRETGSLEPRPHGGGNPRALDEQDDLFLKSLVEEKPDRTIAELTQIIHERLKKKASTASVSRALMRLNLTRKKRVSMPQSATASASSSFVRSTEKS